MDKQTHKTSSRTFLFLRHTSRLVPPSARHLTNWQEKKKKHQNKCKRKIHSYTWRTRYPAERVEHQHRRAEAPTTVRWFPLDRKVRNTLLFFKFSFSVCRQVSEDGRYGPFVVRWTFHEFLCVTPLNFYSVRST